jgi:hypothetical protein
VATLSASGSLPPSAEWSGLGSVPINFTNNDLVFDSLPTDNFAFIQQAEDKISLTLTYRYKRAHGNTSPLKSTTARHADSVAKDQVEY